MSGKTRAANYLTVGVSRVVDTCVHTRVLPGERVAGAGTFHVGVQCSDRKRIR